MLVKDIMSKEPQYISPDTSLTQASQLLRDNDFGFLPVGENDRLIGTVTDRDIIINGISEGSDPNATTAREVMGERVLYCYEDDDIDTAAGYMEKEQVHRLIVLNQDKRYTGIVSIGDVARQCDNDELCGQIVEGISEVA